MDRAPLAEKAATDLAEWLSGDPRRKGAFLRARALALQSSSARALGRGYDPKAFGAAAAPKPSRRAILGWGTGIAAAIAAAAVVGFSLEAPEAYATTRGEVKRTPLPDGSMLTLNTQTRLNLARQADACTLDLLDGEIYLDGKGSRLQALSIRAAGCELTPEGATFGLHRKAGGVTDIVVSAGTLRLKPPGWRASRLIMLRAGSSAVIEPPARGETAFRVTVGQLTIDAIARRLAWLEGNIAFDNTTVADAADAFKRYSDLQIIIEDRALAQRTVTGLFAANDPEAFARSIAALFHAEVQTLRSALVLRRSNKV